MKVVFSAENHQYFYGETKYNSVSSVFSKFKESFDAERISKIMVLKELIPEQYDFYSIKFRNNKQAIIENLEKFVVPEFYEHKVAELRASWEEKGSVSRERGTAFHKMMEDMDITVGVGYNEFNNKTYALVPKVKETEFDNEAYSDDLSTLADGYYNEFLIFDHDNRIAGQMDRLFIETIDGVRYADIGDWKTDKAISKAYLKFKGYFMYPFHKIACNNYNEYSIKLSMYAYMLEKFGFTIRKMGITHVKLDADLNIKIRNLHETKDFRNLIPEMLNVWKII